MSQPEEDSSPVLMYGIVAVIALMAIFSIATCVYKSVSDGQAVVIRKYTSALNLKGWRSDLSTKRNTERIELPDKLIEPLMPTSVV